MEDGEVAPAARATARCRPCRHLARPRGGGRRAAGGRRPAADAGLAASTSGAASADAWQRTCPILRAAQLEYSTRRHELVVLGAVTLNHRTYHEACIAARAMPSAG